MMVFNPATSEGAAGIRSLIAARARQPASPASAIDRHIVQT
ncbi:hypothetical protein [Mesorhizobium sp. A623]